MVDNPVEVEEASEYSSESESEFVSPSLGESSSRQPSFIPIDSICIDFTNPPFNSPEMDPPNLAERERQERERLEQQRLEVERLVAERLAEENRRREERERNEDNDQQEKAMRDYLQPERTSLLGPIVFPRETQAARNAFTAKSGAWKDLPSFHGRENEDPYEFIRTYENQIRNMATDAQYETACMKMFESSLQDRALKWFRMLEPQTLTTFAQVKNALYKKYFSEGKTKSLTRQIQGFRQDKGESFYRCWERFKELLMRLPHHGFAKFQLVSFFHLGLNVETAQQIEYLCKGEDFLSKTATEAWNFLEELADRHRNWEPSDMDRSSPFGSGTVVPVTIRDQQLQSQVEDLAKQVKELSMLKPHAVNEVKVEEPCAGCGGRGHTMYDCPTYLAAQQASLEAEVNAAQAWNPYSNTYNPGWRSHPNFGWRDNGQGGGQQNQPP